MPERQLNEAEKEMDRENEKQDRGYVWREGLHFILRMSLKIRNY